MRNAGQSDDHRKDTPLFIRCKSRFWPFLSIASAIFLPWCQAQSFKKCHQYRNLVANIHKSSPISRCQHHYCHCYPYNNLLATKMLVTLFWWQLFYRYSCPTLMLKNRGCCWQKRPSKPTSQSCQQHISSPTSVTNIWPGRCGLRTKVPTELFFCVIKIRI